MLCTRAQCWHSGVANSTDISNLSGHQLSKHYCIPARVFFNCFGSSWASANNKMKNHMLHSVLSASLLFAFLVAAGLQAAAPRLIPPSSSFCTTSWPYTAREDTRDGFVVTPGPFLSLASSVAMSMGRTAQPQGRFLVRFRSGPWGCVPKWPVALELMEISGGSAFKSHLGACSRGACLVNKLVSNLLCL
uniref:Uncharacterized protein n=1 Tax=Eutreptiella gymnastica TaxID=73025 RepID=A0A7S4FF70_9EUGL|mmetsp:Transcript_39237/g.63786  ORF Transcript_39237/g.63786 Transcript_39237/m.63786 type:complete len:190 (+) Transcript_39237:277-846(+)